MGSEDALSASGSDNTPLHTTNSSSSEERIAFLEKELFHWRTQYEILKIGENAVQFNNKEILQNGPSNLSSSVSPSPSPSTLRNNSENSKL